MSDGYKSAAEWKQGISAALGVMPGGWNYSLDGAVEKIEDLMRDSAARERERARAANSALPEPDATNPEHWRFAANLIPGNWRLRSNDRAITSIFNEKADALDAARTVEREREQRIDTAITAYFEAAHGSVPANVHGDVRRGMKAALDAAGLLRGGGRGE